MANLTREELDKILRYIGGMTISNLWDRNAREHPNRAATIVMLPWSDAKEALRAIQERKITVACLVPTQLTMMLEQAQAEHYDLSSVRAWVSAGGGRVGSNLLLFVERGNVVLSPPAPTISVLSS